MILSRYRLIALLLDTVNLFLNGCQLVDIEARMAASAMGFLSQGILSSIFSALHIFC
jgi:hypothetical protein